MNISPSTGDLSYAQFAQASHVIDKSNDVEALQKAAQHFESLFIDMWLKSAREASRVMSADNPLRTPELEMHEEMRDHEMAVHLSNHGGIGLAEVIVKQLQGHPTIEPSSTTTPNMHASAPPASVGHRRTAFADAQQFVDELKPIFETQLRGQNMPILGVLSQAALETGWGQKVMADGQGELSHNLFGIKTEKLNEPHVRIESDEYLNSSWTKAQARFRTYPDWQSSVADYINKLKNSERYADVVNSGSNVREFAHSLASAGFATDPSYADKIMSVYAKLTGMIKP